MGWINRLARLAAIAGALAVSIAPARAQSSSDWPNQPVHMTVPFPAGGPADILARFVAEKLGAAFGQPFVIDNRPGANTAVGAAYAAKRPADGYNLFVVMDVTMVLNPLTTKDLPYDAERDFAPIALMSKNTSLLMVRAEDGPKSVAELIERGRAHPGALNFGAGIITTRLAAEFFNRETGIKAQYIPFNGSPPTVQGLLNKSVDYIVDGAASSLPLIQSGKFRALAKTNNGPMVALPNLRTLAEEAKSPALDDISTWIGLVGPAGLAPEIGDKLAAAIAKIYSDAAFMDQLRNAGLNPYTDTTEKFVAFIHSETARWGKVIRETGIDLN